MQFGKIALVINDIISSQLWMHFFGGVEVYSLTVINCRFKLTRNGK